MIASLKGPWIFILEKQPVKLRGEALVVVFVQARLVRENGELSCRAALFAVELSYSTFYISFLFVFYVSKCQLVTASIAG